jgi:hypothetical protein
MRRTLLAAMSILLLIATAYLSLSLVVLKPPHANFRVWLPLATAVTVQSALALIATTMAQPPAWLRTLTAAGACLLIAIAVWGVRATLTASHFEGYNLLWGAMLTGHGALTLAFFTADFLPSPRERPDRCN